MALPIIGDNRTSSACFVYFSQLLGAGAAFLHAHLVPHIIEFQSLLMPLCIIKIQRMSNRKRHLSAQVPWEQYRYEGIFLHPYKPAAKYKKLSVALLLPIHKTEVHQTTLHYWVTHAGCLPEGLSWNDSSAADSQSLKDNSNLKHFCFPISHPRWFWMHNEVLFHSYRLFLTLYQQLISASESTMWYKNLPSVRTTERREGGLQGYWNTLKKFWDPITPLATWNRAGETKLRRELLISRRVP